MVPSLVIALGGALGSVARYWVGMAVAWLFGMSFPWGTLVINVVGSFVIGWFSEVSLGSGLYPASSNMRLFVLVGLCGGFTTFSSFSLQTLDLLRGGHPLAALTNIALSVALCLGAVALGVWLGGMERPLTPL